MPIKLIAVDMDHTFLRDDKSFDLAKFESLFDKMQQMSIHFVVASGGQIGRLQAYFPKDIRDKITFIAENGAWIIEREQELQSWVIPFDLMLITTQELGKLAWIDLTIAGKKATYVLDTISTEDFNQMLKFCPILEKVVQYQDIDDDILKIGVKNRTISTVKAMEQITEIIANTLCATPSGNISIDITMANTNKGIALARIAQKYGISQEYCIAFGDNENDRTMLKYVGKGYVMENAVTTLFDVSPLRAPSNEDQGVLSVLEKVLGYF